MLAFEVKKLIKNKTIYLLVIVALLLVFYANFVKDNNVDSERVCNRAASGWVLLDNIMSEQDNISFDYDPLSGQAILIGGTPEMNQDYNQLRAHYPALDYEMDFFDDSVTVLSYEFFQQLDEFVTKYDLVVTPYYQQSLDYMLEAYEYLDTNEIDADSFLNEDFQSFQDVLYSNVSLYFGFIPMTLLLFIMANSVAVEYEREQIYFQWTQAVKRAKNVYHKLASGFILSLVYIVAIILFSLFFALVRGNLDFYALYPLQRIGSAGPTSLSLLLFLALVLIFFLVKISLFLTAGLSFGLLFKERAKQNNFLVFALALGLILTETYNSYHSALDYTFVASSLNPFYTNYIDSLLGRADEANLSYSGLLLYLLIATLILLAATRLIRSERKIVLQTKQRVLTKPMGLLQWEHLKQKRFFSNKITYSLVLLLIAVLIFTTVQYDQLQAPYLTSNRYIEAVEREIYVAEANVESAEEILKEDLDDAMRDSFKYTLKEGQAALTRLEKRYSEVKLLPQYFSEKDSKSYYELLEKEFQEEDSEFVSTNIFAPEGGLAVTPSTLINGDISYFSKQVNEDYREKLLESNAKPLALYYDRGLSLYDKTTDSASLNNAINAQLPMDSSSLILLYRLLASKALGPVMILVAVFFFGGNYILDFQKGQQLAFIYTQPLKRKRYYDHKYFSGLLNVVKVLIFILALVLIYGLFFDPRNTLQYPILQYQGVVADAMQVTDYSDYYSWLTLGEYLLKTVVLVFAGALFVYSLVQMFSVRLRTRLSIYLASGAVILFFGLLLVFWPQLAGFNPFSYLLAPYVVTGELGVRYGFLGVNYAQGLVILILSAAVLYLLGKALAVKSKV